jgi:hypothetical protein
MVGVGVDTNVGLGDGGCGSHLLREGGKEGREGGKGRKGKEREEEERRETGGF